MRRLLCIVITVLLLTTSAHAAPLPDFLPEGLAEAMEGEALSGGVTWLAY